MGREKKFIVLENCYNNKLNFKIGYPIYHKDLIDKSDETGGWQCIGGGFWNLNVNYMKNNSQILIMIILRMNSNLL